MKIDIGCGLKKEPGFIRIDDDPNVEPDHLVNIETDNLPFEDNSVDEIRAWHVLEHIGPGFFHLLQEIYRVGKNGAIFDIKVPHPHHDHFLNDTTHVRPITVEGMRMFSKKFSEHCSKTYGSVSGLAFKFGVDFELIDFEYVYDNFYIPMIENFNIRYEKGEVTDQELLSYQRLFREANNVAIEIKIKMVIVKT